MPRKKLTRAQVIARLKSVKKLGRDLELKLKVIEKDLERMMDHWEHVPNGTKRRRRRR
jgi:hypothetical protein